MSVCGDDGDINNDDMIVIIIIMITTTWRRMKKRERQFSIIINLIYIAQFDTNGILTALYIVISYIQMQYVHI